MNECVVEILEIQEKKNDFRREISFASSRAEEQVRCLRALNLSAMNRAPLFMDSPPRSPSGKCTHVSRTPLGNSTNTPLSKTRISKADTPSSPQIVSPQWRVRVNAASAQRRTYTPSREKVQSELEEVYIALADREAEVCHEAAVL